MLSEGRPQTEEKEAALHHNLQKNKDYNILFHSAQYAELNAATNTPFLQPNCTNFHKITCKSIAYNSNARQKPFIQQNKFKRPTNQF